MDIPIFTIVQWPIPEILKAPDWRPLRLFIS